MSESSKLQAQLHAVARQGQKLSQLLERGHADTPMADYFAAFDHRVAATPLGIVLVGLTAASRDRALTWLGGEKLCTAVRSLPDGPRVLGVDLRPGPFTLGTNGSVAEEFEDAPLDALAQRLRSEQDVRLGWPAEMQRVRVTITGDLEAVLASPPALVALLQGVSVVLVAAPSNYTPHDDEDARLAELAKLVDGFWPLLRHDGEGAPHTGWWKQGATREFRVRLVPAVITNEEFPARPPLLTDPGQPLRQGLVCLGIARQLQAAAQMVSDRFDQEQRRMSARQGAAARRIQTLDDEAGAQDLRSGLERMRTELQEDLAKLAAELQETNRRATLPTGPLAAEIRKRVEGLAPDHMREETVTSTIRLTVDKAFLAGLTATAKQVVRSQLHEDLKTIRDKLAKVQEHMERRLAKFRGTNVRFECAVPNEQKIWNVMNEMVSIDLRYRGERPKRGFLMRLGEGRRRVYMILMTVSLFGSAFGFRRGIIVVAIVLMVLFSAAVAWTFVTWRREDRDRIDKELHRVRDSLSAEARRFLSEVQREKMSRLSTHLEDVVKRGMRSIEEIGRETAKARQEEISEQKQDVRARMRSLEQVARDVGSYERQILQLRQMCADVLALSNSHLDAILQPRSPRRA